jgi:putative transposase
VAERAKPYRGHRFPGEVIAPAVRLYLRFTLSFRDVEELLVERGIAVSYETVRRWVAKFGAPYADELRRREVRVGRTWHVDEMAIRIGGRLHWLWRAVERVATWRAVAGLRAASYRWLARGMAPLHLRLPCDREVDRAPRRDRSPPILRPCHTVSITIVGIALVVRMLSPPAPSCPLTTSSGSCR